MKLVVWGMLCLWATGCSSVILPSDKFWLEPQQARALAGDIAAKKLEHKMGGCCSWPMAQQRLRRLSDRLIAHSPELAGEYSFQILDSDEWNAFSLPGRRVYLTKKLYEQIGSDEMLLAVLAHEMAHLISEDSFKSYDVDSQELLDREIQADRQAQRYLHRAGIGSQALADLLQLLEQKNQRLDFSHRINQLNQTQTFIPR